MVTALSQTSWGFIKLVIYSIVGNECRTYCLNERCCRRIKKVQGRCLKPAAVALLQQQIV